MILNVDGSSFGNPVVLGYGGLIRNADDAWVYDFAGNIGYFNILHPELMMLYHGLCMVWQLGIKDLMYYSDTNYAIKFISESINV
ncbi:unnamed protein product [Lathyrus oleraceus]